MTLGRVVVTGGAGFIGAAVVNALAMDGAGVVVVDSMRPDVHARAADDAGESARETLGDRLVVADVRDLEVLRGVIRGANAVVHLAAKVGLGVNVDDIDDYVSSNDLGTAVVLRACAGEGVSRVVQASSMVVYGEGRYTCEAHGVVAPGPRAVNSLRRGEFEPPCPQCGSVLEPGLVYEGSRLDPRSTYAATKVAQEHLATSWARETHGTAVLLRLHNVYGPGMPRDTPYAGVAARFLSSLERGEPPRVFEDGHQRRDFVHVDDVAQAFVAALGGVGQGHHAYNVGSGVVTTIGEMAAALAADRRGAEPVVTGEFRLGDVRHITASSDLAAIELAWRARIPLCDGVTGLTVC